MTSIVNAVEQAVVNLFGITPDKVDLTRPDSKFGDFACNVAMQISKRLGKNPQEVAQQIASVLEQYDIIDKATVAGPGFINIFVNNNYFESVVSDVIKDGDSYGINDSNLNKVIIAEYSDPNPLKPLHAGHLYTTLVGDSVARLLESTGAKVVRINYGGDVGLHVGKSMWAIMKKLGGEYADKLSEIPVSERPTWLGECYVEGTNAYEDDESAKSEIIETNKRVYKLHQDSDTTSAFALIYWRVRQWSYDYFAKLYESLEVHSFDRVIPESEVTPLGLKTVNEQLNNGVYTKSEGAVIFAGDDYGMHNRVFITSEGLPTYETKDVGLLLTKWQDYKFDKSIVITANEQSQYMEVMLKSVSLFDAEPAAKSVHLAHGVVKMQGGVKMSSRKGNILSALEIINSATEASKIQSGKDNPSAVLAAIKYSFLKVRIGGDIAYDPQESVSMVGNSGPYLQYAHVRARSILAKSTLQPQHYEFNDADRVLINKISEYPSIVSRASTELMPHYICTYLYELSQIFNSYYEHNAVIGSQREQQLLALLKAYSQVLKNGLNLLGISAPEQM